MNTDIPLSSHLLYQDCTRRECTVGPIACSGTTSG